jgi:hypothetical protein
MPYIVTGAAVQITAAGRTHFLETDAVIPEGVDADVLDRLVADGLIADFEIVEVEEIAPERVFTQAEVDAAVQAAADANEADLEQAREIVKAEATKVAQAAIDLENAKAAFEAEKAGAARPEPQRAPRAK